MKNVPLTIFSAVALLLMFILPVCAVEKSKPLVLADRIPVNGGAIELFSSKPMKLTSNEWFSVGVIIEPNIMEGDKPLIPQGDILLYVYATTPSGNVPIFIKKLDAIIDGCILSVDQIPIVSEEVKVVVFSRTGTKQPLSVTCLFRP